MSSCQLVTSVDPLAANALRQRTSLIGRIATGLKVADGKRTGIDLGSQFAKLIVSECKQGRVMVRRAHCQPTAIQDLSAEDLATLLITWLHEQGDLATRDLSLTLPLAYYDLETVTVPVGLRRADDTQELGKFAWAALKSILGPGADDAAYDGWVSQADANSAELHLVWTDRKLVSKLYKLLRTSGWYCRYIGYPQLEVARAAHLQQSTVASQLVVDIGSSLNFSWVANGTTSYLRNSIPFSTPTPTRLLAERLSLRENEVEVLLRDTGLLVMNDVASESSSQCHLARLITHHLQDYLQALAFEVHRTVQYVARKSNDADRLEIVLTGGQACVRNLDTWLTEHLACRTIAISLPDNIHWQSATRYSPQFASALALSITGVVR